VQCKRHALGIESFRARNKFRWTAARDRLLGTRSDTALANLFGCERHKVKARRQELGIPSSVYRYWTIEEERLLETRPAKEVARLTGRTRRAIEHRRHFLSKQRKNRK
jgi:hypothetical protein